MLFINRQAAVDQALRGCLPWPLCLLPHALLPASHAPPLIQASGGDDGALRVWDLRAFKEGAAVASFSYHRGPVTSVEWCPYEPSMLATTGADNQLAVWDLALERDPGGWWGGGRQGGGRRRWSVVG